MKKKIPVKVLSVFLSTVLILSAPLFAYADTDNADQGSQAADPVISDDVSEDAAVVEAADIPSSETDTDDLPVGDDGEYYVYEIEEEPEEGAITENGYDPELLAEAKEALAIQEDASAFEVLETVYDLAVTSLPAGTEQNAASDFLFELLRYAESDCMKITGTAEAGEAFTWILARFLPDEPYYIMDPARDLIDPDTLEEVTLDADAEEDLWFGFLLGLEDLDGFAFDEEYLTEEFSAAYPISETAYEEPAEPSEPEEEADGADDSEEDTGDSVDPASAEIPENTGDEAASAEDPESAADVPASQEDTDTVQEGAGPLQEDAENTSADAEDSSPASDEKTDSDADTDSESESTAEAAEEESLSPAETEEPENLPEIPEELRDGRLMADYYTIASGSCGASGSDLTWAIVTSDYENFFLLIDGNGAMTNYSTSSGVTTAPWNTSISNYITYPMYFYDASKLVGVVFGTNVTSVGNYAFTGLTGLQAVAFAGNKITSIGVRAFKNCSSLTDITLKSGLTSIGQAAFYECTSLAKLVFPSSVRSIGQQAFCRCYELSTVKLPFGLESLGSQSIYHCTDVYYPNTQTQWKAIGGPSAVSGSTKVHFTTSIKKAKITMKTYVRYTGVARKPKVTVTCNGKTLTKGTDYKLVYKNNKKAGKATVTITGLNDYHSSVKKTFRIMKVSIKNASHKLTGVKNTAYTGAKVSLSGLKLKVKVNGVYKTLKKGTDYTVEYRNRKKISTKTSKAKVIIKGKGNFKGTLSKTFMIVRGNPGLKFSASKYTRKILQGAFTKKVSKKAKESLQLTWYSSNKSVATVNKSTGKVKPKALGTTTITVRSKSNKHFKAGKASYKLTVRALNYAEVKSFKNFSVSTIPLRIFQLFYSNVQAQKFYEQYKKGGSGGNCFGITNTDIMMNLPDGELKVTDFDADAKHISDIYSRFVSYKKTDFDMSDIIEAVQASQWADPCSKLIYGNAENPGQSMKNAISYVKGGKPVCIMIFPDQEHGGHALLGYKIEKVSSTKTRMYVFDCNWPDDTSCYITFSTTSSGTVTHWSYPFGPDVTWKDGPITFIPGKTYNKIWRERKAATKLSGMFISTDNFEIRDASGSTVAAMNNGSFASKDDEIYLAYSVGAELKDHLVYAPAGEYRIINTDPVETEMEVTAMDTNSCVTVSTQSDTVTVTASDDAGVSTAVFEAPEGENYEVTVLTADSEEAEPEEIVFSGEGTGEEITLGTEDNAVVIENAEGVLLSIDGEETVYTEAG